tara:strand:- start:49 stop:561 length:513 start_codon:yes stop_codon:yes gene_type:complete
MAITRLNNNSITSITALPSGVQVASTPAFHATLSSTQTITNNTFTKLQIDNEIYDTDGCYDNSTNYRFTPTTAGKYFVYGCSMTGGSNGELDFSGSALYKNGSQQTEHFTDFRNNRGGSSNFTFTSIIMDMNGSSDYAELYGRMKVNAGNVNIQGGTNGQTYFGAYKLIT